MTEDEPWYKTTRGRVIAAIAIGATVALAGIAAYVLRPYWTSRTPAAAAPPSDAAPVAADAPTVNSGGSAPLPPAVAHPAAPGKHPAVPGAPAAVHPAAVHPAAVHPGAPPAPKSKP